MSHLLPSSILSTSSLACCNNTHTFETMHSYKLLMFRLTASIKVASEVTVLKNWVCISGASNLDLYDRPPNTQPHPSWSLMLYEFSWKCWLLGNSAWIIRLKIKQSAVSLHDYVSLSWCFYSTGTKSYTSGSRLKNGSQVCSIYNNTTIKSNYPYDHA